jgi:hypothetical protein
MTFDKFLKRNQLIADHLAQIAAHRHCIGWVDSATPLDMDLRDLLAAQERLVTAAERLLESCDKSSQSSAHGSALSSMEPQAMFVELTPGAGDRSLPMVYSQRTAAASTTH